MEYNDIIRGASEYAAASQIHTFTPGKTYINPAAPLLVPEDVAVLTDAVLQMWYTEWKYCAKFERSLSKLTGKPFVNLVNSGSSASLVAMAAALEMFPGKYVITCATGFPTTVSPIYQLGRQPIYIDMRDDLTPDLEQLEHVLDVFPREQIAGAIFAHTLGFPYDERRVRELLGPDKFLISDCCDALGATLLDELFGVVPVGTFSDFSTFSFFPSHHIMAAEGGAVMTNTKDSADLVTTFSNWGRSCYCRPGESNTCGKRFCWPDRGNLPEGWDHKYVFSHLGYNLKMTEFQGALGWSQMNRVDSMIASRRENYKFLYDQLNRHDLNGYIYLIPPTKNFSPFGFPILVTNPDVSTTEFIAFLEDHKVGTRRLFGGNLVRQPGFMNLDYASAPLPGSDRLMNNMFWVSVSPALTPAMRDYIVYVIDLFFIEKGYV